jgi:hypothetical protein
MEVEVEAFDMSIPFNLESSCQFTPTGLKNDASNAQNSGE